MSAMEPLCSFEGEWRCEYEYSFNALRVRLQQ